MAAVCCLTVPVGTAGALEPGVHVDPGSPAAKEYALPLDQARQTGLGYSGVPWAFVGGYTGSKLPFCHWKR